MSRKQKKTCARILAAALLLAAAFLSERLLFPDAAPLVGLALYLPAYLTAGYDVLRRAARGILHGNVLDENFLMAFATLGALAIGFLPQGEAEYAEAVFVMVFYQTGELFQSVSVGKSRKSIASLYDLRPESARILWDGVEKEIPPEEAAVGETVRVKPGERIPLDGCVVSGASDVDTAALTGESLPRAVSPGDRVFSGCTNLTGLIDVRVEKEYGDGTAARVARLVQESAMRKSKRERFVTRFAAWYTPFVVAAAVAIAVLPPLFTGEWIAWITRGLTFLVISCPCALVISVPLAFFCGMGGASRAGILAKGSDHLEALAAANVAVFDKTGTLTRGIFAVSAVIPAEGVGKEELLRTAATAEQGSLHPVARALARAAGGELPPLSEAKELAGYGILAKAAGEKILCGNRKLLQKENIPVDGVSEKTAVYVARGGKYLGRIEFCDEVRPFAKESVAALAARGVGRTVMLTGDRAESALAVAKELGIGEVRAELFPQDKVREVEVLLSSPGTASLLFVGDGINDAPVLSRADVGVAMGGMGSDAAIEAADVVLMDDDIRKLPLALSHAKKTLRIVKENVVFSLLVKFSVLILCAAGVLGRWQMPAAVFADVGVAFLAILNAMRALRVKNV